MLCVSKVILWFFESVKRRGVQHRYNNSTVHPHGWYSKSYLDDNQIHFTALMLCEPEPSYLILSAVISTDSLIHICLLNYSKCDRKLSRCKKKKKKQQV